MLFEDLETDYRRDVINTKDRATNTQDQEIEKYNEINSNTVDENLSRTQGYLHQAQEGIEIKKGYEEEFERIIEERINNPLNFKKAYGIQEIEMARDEIIQKHLEIVCKSLKCQAASIFLVSKDSKIRHIGTAGTDKKHKLIDFKWCRSEFYDIHHSGRIGKAVNSENTGFGVASFIENLEDEFIDEIVKAEYLKRFSALKARVAPLHGAHRSFGLLMVINKQDDSEKDTNLVSELATSIAYGLSLFRSNTRIKIQQYLSQKINESHIERNTLCQEALDSLIKNPETPYQAGIIRIYDPNYRLLKMQATSEFGLKSERNNNQDIELGQGLAGLVAISQRYLTLEDINREENLSKFRNHAWIKENSLRFFCCFPMVSQDELMGTLSLYTSCNHGFHSEGLQFLQSIANLLSALIYGSKKYAPLNLMKDLNLDEILVRFNDLVERLGDEFDDSQEKIKLWLTSPHADFGGKSPLYYLRQGKFDVVESLVEAIESGQTG